MGVSADFTCRIRSRSLQTLNGAWLLSSCWTERTTCLCRRTSPPKTRSAMVSTDDVTLLLRPPTRRPRFVLQPVCLSVCPVWLRTQERHANHVWGLWGCWHSTVYTVIYLCGLDCISCIHCSCVNMINQSCLLCDNELFVYNAIKFLYKLFFSSIIPLLYCSLCYQSRWNKGFHKIS